MKRSVILWMSLVAVLLPPMLRSPHADPREIAVFDGPRGNWLATVRGDVSFEILEESDGWRRVRMEGWIASPVSGEAADAPTGAVASAGAATAAAQRGGRGVTVSGMLPPSPADPSSRPGAGLVVLLVGGLESLDEQHARAGEDCRESLTESQREMDERRDAYQRQMNSSDNFKEAAQRNDRARKALERAEQAHRERFDACRRTADELFQTHAIARVVSDMAGRFEFDRVPGGKYRIVASETGGEAPRAWVYDCLVEGAEPVVIDPQSDRSDMLPYWGLGRFGGS